MEWDSTPSTSSNESSSTQPSPLARKRLRNKLKYASWLSIAAVPTLWAVSILSDVREPPPPEELFLNGPRPSRLAELPNIPESKVPLSAEKLWANIYKTSMNLSVEPCDDFFRSVCDGYLKNFVESIGNTDPPEARILPKINEALGALFLERLHEIRNLVLDETKTEELRDSEYEVLKFFDSCVNSDSAENIEYSSLRLGKLLDDVDIDGQYPGGRVWRAACKINESECGALKETACLSDVGSHLIF